MRSGISWPVAIAAVVALACQGEPALIGPGELRDVSLATVSSIEIAPASWGAAVGQSVQLTAVTRNARGEAVAAAVTWSSTNDAVVRISASGQATAAGSGSAALRASTEGVTASIPVAVGAAAPPPPPAPAPGTVTDLAISSVTETTADLTFTEVSNGQGAPASYEVRYAAEPMDWNTAAPGSGTCKAPVGGQTVGESRTCTITGLTASTAYEFQLRAFRGTPGEGAVFGTVSNVAKATTVAIVAAVASVAVSPSPVALVIGENVTLTATLKDADGDPVSGRVVSWSSSAPEIAEVDETGHVTGLQPGSVTISAVSEGKSGSAAATVTRPAWPNAPASWRVLSDEPGDAPVPVTEDGPWTNSWRIGDNEEGNVTTVPDLKSPYSPGRVIQYRYPTGFRGGDGPGKVYRGLGGATRVYAGFWWKVSDPWQGHLTGSNKVAYMFTDSQGSIMMVMQREHSGRYGLWMYPQFTTSSAVWLEPNVNNPVPTLGVWHLVEWMIEYTPGGTGRIRWWMDRELVGDYDNQRFPSQGLTDFRLSAVWGGIGDVKTQTDYYWYDHVHLRTP